MLTPANAGGLIEMGYTLYLKEEHKKNVMRSSRKHCFVGSLLQKIKKVPLSPRISRRKC